MDLPDYLVNQIEEGKVVLFLGAGSSSDAVDQYGNSPPLGNKLAEKISDKFLGGKYKNSPLSQVSEYAISESSLFEVQDYIREIFEPFQPSKSHILMTSFKWWAIVTTNYDLIIERAYQLNKKSAGQRPVSFIENGDKVEDKLRDSKCMPLLKLHGCVTRISNNNCPLILSTDQYIQYKKGRDRIFDHLKNWGYERIIVFIGHSLQDPDLRAILLELTQIVEYRQRYYTVTPKVDDISKRFWETKKITTLEGTFSDFMSTIDKKNPSPFRGVLLQYKHGEGILKYKHPIYERFKSNEYLLSKSCLQFLEVDVDYVKVARSQNIVNPVDFYKGYNPDWSAIEQNLDVKRNIVDDILEKHFIIKDENSERLQFILLKGHAGSGKTIILKRIAWNAAHDFDCMCLYLKQYGKLSTSAIVEIANYCTERIFIFIDNVADRVNELSYFANSIGLEGKNITIIGAERLNEWNISCEPIADLVTDEYKLQYLLRNEIISLISLLEKHNALGTLKGKTLEEKCSAFEVRAGRQLLVALHEATLGKTFEEIIEDEYKNIKPMEAQLLYLTICTLNRLNVPVRAGIIFRLHGINFEEFKKRLFLPLENVVHTSYNNLTRDYLYQARHPHIAEIVFDRILKHLENKFAIYIKCLKAINIDYESDRKAFKQIVRGKTLLDLFPNYELVKIIYQEAQNIAKDDPYLLHQMAIYEMNRPNGNMQSCLSLLKKANKIRPDDSSIKHSLTEFNLHCAEIAKTDLEKEAYLNDAERGACDLVKKLPFSPFGYHTLIKASLARLRFYLNKPTIEQSTIEKIITDAEKYLADGLQQFPENSHLLEADSHVAYLLSDSSRAVESLKKAFESNPRNSFVALSLYRQFVYNKSYKDAKDILEKALNAKPHDNRLHFAYADLLITTDEKEGDLIAYHLKRSFTPGDKNYFAQILYGRQLFINDNIVESNDLFNSLRTIRCSPDLRDKLSSPLKDTFTGEIIKKDISFCFILRDGKRDHIYAHVSNMKDSVWEKIVIGLRVCFKIAFTLRGVNAFDVELESCE